MVTCLTYNCSWGRNELAGFFATKATDEASRPSYFYCHIWGKDVSVSTHGVYELLGHFQGVKHSLGDKRLRLETTSWRVLDYEGNLMTEEEVKRLRQGILRAPQVARYLIVDSSGAVDLSLPALAKVSALVEALGVSYELFHQLGLSSLLSEGKSTWT